MRKLNHRTLPWPKLHLIKDQLSSPNFKFQAVMKTTRLRAEAFGFLHAAAEYEVMLGLSQTEKKTTHPEDSADYRIVHFCG